MKHIFIKLFQSIEHENHESLIFYEFSSFSYLKNRKTQISKYFCIPSIGKVLKNHNLSVGRILCQNKNIPFLPKNRVL